MLNKCKSKFFFRVERYNKRPYTLLHNPKYTQDNKDRNDSKANKSIDERNNQNTHLHSQNHFKQNLIKRNAFLDSGSNITLISDGM